MRLVDDSRRRGYTVTRMEEADGKLVDAFPFNLVFTSVDQAKLAVDNCEKADNRDPLRITWHANVAMVEVTERHRFLYEVTECLIL